MNKNELSDRIRHVVKQRLPLTQASMRARGIDVQQASTWPPGSLMAYWSDDYFGLGIVVANRNDSIAVIWCQGCERVPHLLHGPTSFSTYKVKDLNALVIRKVL